MSVILRLAGCLLFLPLTIPFVVVAPLSIIVAVARWLVGGSNEEATERILLNPVLCWAGDLPLMLFQVAEHRSAR